MKLKSICGIFQRETGCPGVIEIPPGNFKTSKADECPKSAGDNDRFTCCRASSTNDDFSRLRNGELIETYLE